LWAIDPVLGPNDYRGVYTPITPWSDWRADPTLTTLADDLEALGAQDSWCMICVHGGDEAGNVQPWAMAGTLPDDDLDMADDTLHIAALQAKNCNRFFFSGIAPPDTRVRANFWHDALSNNNQVNPEEPVLIPPVDNNLGSITIVPMPGFEAVTGLRVAAEFFISIDLPPEVRAGDTFDIDWELFEDGVLVNSALQTPIEPNQTIRFPLPVNASRFGDPNLIEDVTYVFRATASMLRPGGVRLYDPSPANVFFIVVPFDSSAYVAQALEPDRQPIVIQEEQ
jgi:hypothetical protein